ncbi:MAG: type II toxin-antitoxin system HicA family toxin [Desulfobacterales bacterium]|jgi:predicted RNA binding protein YcfA (HicA-like mRNA interferase family)
MPKIKPISRRELISKLKSLEFEGPFIATKHQYMIKGKHKIFIPNPHGGKDVGIPLLNKIIRQIGISKNDFIDL